MALFLILILVRKDKSVLEMGTKTEQGTVLFTPLEKK